MKIKKKYIYIYSLLVTQRLYLCICIILCYVTLYVCIINFRWLPHIPNGWILHRICSYSERLEATEELKVFFLFCFFNPRSWFSGWYTVCDAFVITPLDSWQGGSLCWRFMHLDVFFSDTTAHAPVKWQEILVVWLSTTESTSLPVRPVSTGYYLSAPASITQHQLVPVSTGSDQLASFGNNHH